MMTEPEHNRHHCCLSGPLCSWVTVSQPSLFGLRRNKGFSDFFYGLTMTNPDADASARQFLRRVIERNRHAHANTIIYFPFVGLKKRWNRIYELTIEALEMIRVRHDLNGPLCFPRSTNVHVTWGAEQEELRNPPVPRGSGSVFRIVRVLDGDLRNEVVHYAETWYTEEMYHAWKDG